MSMYAVVTDQGLTEWSSLPVGQRIEVLGFVHFDRQTLAVYRDDEGVLFHIPIWAIRMDPASVKVEA